MSNNNPKITIVTVVFNAIDCIENTILSVINQDYDNKEYIIIDGGSTDGTLEIIKKYNHEINFWISEKDLGIYDAMNKGINAASGFWINFMNAGDCFYDSKVLYKVFNNSVYDKIDILYGNHQVIYPNKKIKLSKPGKLDNLWKGSQFSHQATFVNVDYHKRYKFNLCKKIAGDFDFFYNAWEKNIKFKKLDFTIAQIESGGLSDVKRIDCILEFWSISKKNNYTNCFFILRIIKEIAKEIIKNFIKS